MLISWVGGLDAWDLIRLAPLVFPIHVLEESPGFVAWFNSLVQIPERQITQKLFYKANAGAFAISLVLALLSYWATGPFLLLLSLTWFSFLMLANALSVHLIPSIVQRRYVPGTVTALLLYLPFYTWYLWLLVTGSHLPIGLVLGAVVIGATPMVIHGYRVLFRGTTLF